MSVETCNITFKTLDKPVLLFATTVCQETTNIDIQCEFSIRTNLNMTD